MNDIPILFYILAVMVVLWLVMVNKLFSLLKSDHPLIYLDWGKPFLFDGEALKKRTGQLLLKFLLKREYKSLDNRKLSKLCGFMLIYMIIYLVLLISLVAYMVLKEII